MTEAVTQTGATLRSSDSTDWPAQKQFAFSRTPAGFEITCSLKVRRSAPGAASVYVGLESIVNFLAPSAPDRYFEIDGQRYPLRYSAVVPGTRLRVVDEWQKSAVTLAAPGASEFWILPIETVSESEEGFERIYQGSQIIAVWKAELAPNVDWSAEFSHQVDYLG